jgi:hypothetical protein
VPERFRGHSCLIREKKNGTFSHLYRLDFQEDFECDLSPH